MAQVVDFAGSNHVWNPAPGTEHVVQPLPCYRAGSETISRWKLTEAEKAAVLATGDVWLSMATTRGPPPVFVSGFPLMAITTPDGETVLDAYDPNAIEPKED